MLHPQTSHMGLLDAQTEETLESMADEAVLALSVRHPEQFAEILRRYQSAFLRKAESVLGSREDAEEVAQEAFTKIYRNAEKFQVVEGASFKSWGYKILMNTAFTRYQKLKKERGVTVKLDPEFYEMLPDSESKQFEKFELSEYLVSILSKMPDQLARVLEQHFIEGKPQKDIAQEEGVSVGAIKTRVHRAKEAFKKVEQSFVI